jgi:hypothetical protein
MEIRVQGNDGLAMVPSPREDGAVGGGGKADIVGVDTGISAPSPMGLCAGRAARSSGNGEPPFAPRLRKTRRIQRALRAAPDGVRRKTVYAVRIEGTCE